MLLIAELEAVAGLTDIFLITGYGIRMFHPGPANKQPA
jgi:hypothetical protein